MSKIAILTETAADLTDRQKQLDHVFQIPLYILFQDEAYKENEEITADQYFERLDQVDYLPTTSQPTPGDFQEKYQEILALGYEDIIVITLSSELSGTYQSASLAARDYLNVHVINTSFATMAEALIVEQAQRMVVSGLEVEEIVSRIKEVNEETRFYAVLVTLENIVKGGRLPKIANTLTSLLGLKFIISFSEGKLSFLKQVRTINRGMEFMERELAKAMAHSKYPIRVSVAHIDNLDEAKKFKERLESNFADLEVEISSIGPVIGTHGGKGAFGIGWVPVIDE